MKEQSFERQTRGERGGAHKTMEHTQDIEKGKAARVTLVFDCGRLELVGEAGAVCSGWCRSS